MANIEILPCRGRNPSFIKNRLEDGERVKFAAVLLTQEGVKKALVALGESSYHSDLVQHEIFPVARGIDPQASFLGAGDEDLFREKGFFGSGSCMQVFGRDRPEVDVDRLIVDLGLETDPGKLEEMLGYKPSEMGNRPLDAFLYSLRLAMITHNVISEVVKVDWSGSKKRFFDPKTGKLIKIEDSSQ